MMTQLCHSHPNDDFHHELTRGNTPVLHTDTTNCAAYRESASMCSSLTAASQGCALFSATGILFMVRSCRFLWHDCVDESIEFARTVSLFSLTLST
jgi:hypothetical protein